MSFVVFVGCQYYGIMLGDKRAISYDGKIKSDNANKIYRINSEVVLCTGGDVSIKQYVIDGINAQSNIQELSFDEIKYIAYKRLSEVNDYINFKEYKEMNSSVGIMGIKNGNIHFISMYISYNQIKTVENIFKSDGESGYCAIANGQTKLGDIFYQNVL